MLPYGQTVAITASRDLGPDATGQIELGMARLLSTPRSEIRFGGARGGDTIALRAAREIIRSRTSREPQARPTLVVFVPSSLADQPREAIRAIEECADRVCELGLPVGMSVSYHRRNRMMLDGGVVQARRRVGPGGLSDQLIPTIRLPADALMVFWNGGPGGTAYTICYAEKRGIQFAIVRIRGLGDRASGADA